VFRGSSEKEKQQEGGWEHRLHTDVFGVDGVCGGESRGVFWIELESEESKDRVVVFKNGPHEIEFVCKSFYLCSKPVRTTRPISHGVKSSPSGIAIVVDFDDPLEKIMEALSNQKNREEWHEELHYLHAHGSEESDREKALISADAFGTLVDYMKEREMELANDLKIPARVSEYLTFHYDDQNKEKELEELRKDNLIDYRERVGLTQEELFEKLVDDDGIAQLDAYEALGRILRESSRRFGLYEYSVGIKKCWCLRSVAPILETFLGESKKSIRVCVTIVLEEGTDWDGIPIVMSTMEIARAIREAGMFDITKYNITTLSVEDIRRKVSASMTSRNKAVHFKQVAPGCYGLRSAFEANVDTANEGNFWYREGSQYWEYVQARMTKEEMTDLIGVQFVPSLCFAIRKALNKTEHK
jgi:hypothetical protein